MRRVIAAVGVVAAMVAVGPHVANAETPSGWEPAPATPPYDWAAGTRCDFPTHSQPLLDEVLQRVLDTYPDGKPKLVAYKGPLDIRVTNTANGKATDVDAGGSALVDYRPDGSQMWYAYGPVMTGWRDDGGNMPRGLYRLDGIYTLDITADGAKTLTLVHGTAEPLCPLIE
ncbi:hypothetical protein ACPA54_15760 [Uniformispora flossi]|uniref:hypothetical protein n=1 Tax=Uniformispora flossi TaxID=3390723 RepID=UPI003C2F439A